MRHLHRNIFDKYEETANRLARERPRTPHLSAGALAPATAVYLEHNVVGIPTGRRVDMNQGEPMPHAPRGFTWRRKTLE